MFKVGDIITGLTEKQYAITNSRGTFEVVETTPTFRVRVLTHKDYGDVTTEVYPVDPQKFKLVESFDPQTAVLRKIAHLRNLFENRKKYSEPTW